MYRNREKYSIKICSSRSLIVIWRSFREQFVTYGCGVHYLYDHTKLGFRDEELPSLMDGKYMGVGLTKAVKVLEGEGGKTGSAFVVTDVTKGAFHVDEQNLLEKISQMSIFIDPRSGQSTFTVKAAMQPYNKENILEANQRSICQNNVWKEAADFSDWKHCCCCQYIETTDGGQCTVEQYFKKHYNIQLKCPGIFTVSERRNPHSYYPVELLTVAPSQRVTLQQQTPDQRHNPHNYYPVELLTVAPSQRVTLQQQTPDQVATMIKASATLPDNRLHQTRKMKDALDITPRNPNLASAGISVANNFTTVTARVLPTPTIVYGGSQTLKPTDNCKWNGDRSKFLEPAQLTNWAVCATLTQNDARRLQIKDYVQRVEGRCRLRGMQVEPVGEIYMNQRQNFESLRVLLFSCIEVSVLLSECETQ
ncbi:PAZ domain protein [Cooperia oncophora]